MIKFFPVDKDNIKIMTNDIAIITDNTNERQKNGLNYGVYEVSLNQEYIDALNNNNCIALNISGEYVVILTKTKELNS